MTTTLFVKCPGASSPEDVQDTLNSTFSNSRNCVVSVAPINQDKYGNPYTFVEVSQSGFFNESRMDRLVRSLKESGSTYGEKFVYKSNPKPKPNIEWTIKLVVPKEEFVKPVAASATLRPLR
jgi:hypothetical protein